VTGLLPQHVEALSASGISREFALANGIRSISAVEANRLLKRSDLKCGGILFVYPNSVEYLNVRLDVPIIADDGKQRRYLGPIKVPIRVYVPAGVLDRLHADPRVVLIVTEGVKKALALVEAGFLAVAIPGVSCWSAHRSDAEKEAKVERRLHPDLAELPLAGRIVVVMFDSDASSNPNVAREMAQLAIEIGGEGALSRVARMPGLEGLSKAGIDDHLGLLSLDRRRGFVEALIASATEPPNIVSGRAIPWPEPLEPAAFHGIAGDFVHVVSPETEADPAGLLLQFLVAFGNLIGRTAYFCVGATRHYLNEYLALVGESGAARKGTSWDFVAIVSCVADATWTHCLEDGLATGEGLIWRLRDPITKEEPVRENGKGAIVGYETVVADAGVTDKRLCVIEPELVSVLKVAEKQGNVLSPILRKAWERGDLKSMSKNSPGRATNAHVSVIGHITPGELRLRLAESERANGFANRFLWLCVARSRFLPDGGSLRPDDLSEIGKRLAIAVTFARGVLEMRRDAAAAELWKRVYPELAEARPGLFGVITGRAEAHVLRLSCIYALLDLSAVVRVEHLRAALAVWRRCLDSARFIFGESLGDPIADELRRAIHEAGAAGLTRKAIRDHFQRHRTSNEIEKALAKLQAVGAVRRETVTDTGGRPAEKWVSVALSTCDQSDQSDQSPPAGTGGPPSVALDASVAREPGDDPDEEVVLL